MSSQRWLIVDSDNPARRTAIRPARPSPTSTIRICRLASRRAPHRPAAPIRHLCTITTTALLRQIQCASRDIITHLRQSPPLPPQHRHRRRRHLAAITITRPIRLALRWLPAVTRPCPLRRHCHRRCTGKTLRPACSPPPFRHPIRHSQHINIINNTCSIPIHSRRSTFRRRHLNLPLLSCF